MRDILGYINEFRPDKLGESIFGTIDDNLEGQKQVRQTNEGLTFPVIPRTVTIEDQEKIIRTLEGQGRLRVYRPEQRR